MESKKIKNNRLGLGRLVGGFTLIEILIVIGIIAILAAIVIVAINPGKQFAQARNTQRTANVNAILNAIGQRMADNKGIFEGTFTLNGDTFTCPQLGSEKDITSSAKGSTTNGDLGCLAPVYLPVLPSEPAGPTAKQYTVELLDSGRVEVCAPQAALEKSIPSPENICVVR